MARELKVEIEVMGGAVPIRLRDCVRRYEIRSAIAELFEVILEVSLKNPDFDVREVVGHPIRISFEGEPYLSRIDGIACRMRQLSSLVEGVSRYEIVVVPPLWLATRRRDHRIFQDASVTDIATRVLAGYGPRIAVPVNRSSPHPAREYCVQYGETDFDFMSRVLADEGVSFYFDHHQRLSWSAPEPTPSTLTFLDDTRSAPAIERPVPYVPPGGALEVSEPFVSSVLVSSGIETSMTTLRDYDFERPAFNFESTAEATGERFQDEAGLESYTYEVGQFTSPDDRERATQLLEEARRSRDVYLLGASFALAAGTRLTLSGHPAEHANCEHLVVASRSRVTVNEDGDVLVHHSHETIPAVLRYRPPRRPKPRIHGTQTAFVVGKQLNADEIDVDNYGRVKVRFHWDRRATSVEGKPTRFIRVSQGWAGQGYGLVLLPRVGDELVIAFQDGDPDEPIAVGRVHNAVFPSPLTLPDTDDMTVSIWKSRSSPSDKSSNEDRFNMIRMQDKSGEEVLELRAQRDFRQETLHDANEKVGHNKSVQVKGAASTGAGSISLSSGSTLTASAGTDMSLKAKGDMSADAGSNMSLDAKKKLSAKAGTDMALTAGASLTADAETMRLKAKGLLEANGQTVRIEAKGGAILNGMGDLLLTGGEIIIQTKGAVHVTAGEANVNATGNVNVKGGVINLNC